MVTHGGMYEQSCMGPRWLSRGSEHVGGGGGCCLVQGHLGSALKMPRDPKSSQVPYGLNQERFNRFSPLVCSSFMIRDLTLVPVVT